MKKKEIIIHIGMHKTGSSSIQRTLYKYLNDKRFTYVDLGSANHSSYISSLFEKDIRKRDNRVNPGSNKKQLNASIKKRLIDNFTTLDDKVMIISGESIRKLSKKELIEFRNFLQRYFQHIQIVAYIRPPKGYMESAFQQIVKGGADHFNIEKIYPRYRKFESFDEVFGRKNVELWKFDPKTFPAGDVVLDFCKRLDIQMNPEDVIKVNESVSKEVLSLLYIYSKYGTGYEIGSNVVRNNYRIINKLSVIKGGKLRFSSSLIKPILEKNREEIEWMEKRLGESLAENTDASPEDIKSEEDLLAIDTETINILKGIIGENFIPKAVKKDSVEEVVDLINILRRQLLKKIDKKQIKRKNEMKNTPLEIAKVIKQANPEKLGKMHEKRIAMVIKGAFAQVKNELKNTEEGVVKVPGLGNFQVRTVEKDKEGKKVNVKRIVFVEAKA